MYLEWIGHNDKEKLNSWDEFLKNSPRGHYCQLSTWLKSYSTYGFGYDVLIAKNEPSGPIIGGAGLLLIGSKLFRIATAPICPIVDIGFEDAAEPILEAVLNHAQGFGASFLQLNFPSSNECELPALLPVNKLPRLPSSRSGIAFGNGSAHNEMMWIDFPQDADDETWSNQTLSSFSVGHRRSIRQAIKAGLTAVEVSTEDEIREGYEIIEQNGLNQGYSIRSWEELRESIIEQVHCGQAFMILVRHEDRNLGAHYGFSTGRRYSYELGGSVRTEKNLNIGYLLHWAAMNKARKLGLLGYDLTSRSSPGVMKFKMGFRPKFIPLVEPRYIVFSELRYKAYCWAYPKLREHRELVSRILRMTAGIRR